jgi:outer membrane protein assembly factor BamB
VKIVFKTLAGGTLFTGALLAQWMTFGGDPQRSGWARNESILNKENVGTLELKWKLRLDNVPMEPTERVKGSAHAVLYALDADTGKELFSSKDIITSFTHFGGIALSNGRLFVTAYDGYVYAFGIKNEER